MSGAITWTVELAVTPGSLAALRPLTREMVEAGRGEPGTLVYERYLDEVAGVVHVLERYRDAAAAVAHMERFSALFGRRLAPLVTRRAFTVYGDASRELRAFLDPLGARYLPRLDGFSR